MAPSTPSCPIFKFPTSRRRAQSLVDASTQHQPIRPLPATMTRPIPYTIHEALYGNLGLEPCVSSIQHSWHPLINHRLSKFKCITHRPKQASQHMFELFVVHVCTTDPYWHVDWVDDVVDYLVPLADTFIPSVTPDSAVQWTSIVRDKFGRQTHRVPQTEENYPPVDPVPTDAIVDVIAKIAPTFSLPPVSRDDLEQMTGLMDEPAKTAVMAYAWFLASRNVDNGWLRPYLLGPLGRRELPPTLDDDALENTLTHSADGRLARQDEELHTVYAPPFVNHVGHLVWYTVRYCRPGDMLALPAESYARRNNVRIYSVKQFSRSVKIHRAAVCNPHVLDLRLWFSWTHGARGIGPCKSLANDVFSLKVVSFDKPVRLECALAAGFRVVQGILVNPAGKPLTVVNIGDGLFKAKSYSHKGDGEPIPWHPAMNFA